MVKGGEGGKRKRKRKGGKKIRKSETEALPRLLAGKAGEARIFFFFGGTGF
jgi:hypothetical protein